MRKAPSIVFALLIAIATPAAAQQYAARRANDVVQLEDAKSQTTISIITSIGNMVLEYKVKGQNIVHFPFASIDEFKAKPSRQCGIPLLAPWANRLDEQAFFANGKHYAFDMQLGNVTGANPIHGLVNLTDKWQVVEAKADGNAAWVTSRLDFYKQPMWMKQFPFAHSIEVTHRLQDGVLEIRMTVTNMSAEPMPMSMGFHPYMKLTDSPRDEWTLSTPAQAHWLLSDAKLPTGVTEPTDHFFTTNPAVLKDYDPDDVFSDLTRDAQGRSTVTLKGKTQRIDLVQGPNYKASVVYSPNPPHSGRPGQPATFIAIEPMAGITNAMNLAQKGLYKDLQSIPAGGTWTESFWIKPSGF